VVVRAISNLLFGGYALNKLLHCFRRDLSKYTCPNSFDHAAHASHRELHVLWRILREALLESRKMLGERSLPSLREPFLFWIDEPTLPQHYLMLKLCCETLRLSLIAESLNGATLARL
jgi:hypothetical protein